MTIDIYSQLYWLTRLNICIGFAIAILIIAVLCTFWWLCDKDLKKSKNYIQQLKLAWIIGYTISLPIIFFLPSKDDMVFIIATGKTIKFVESDSSINKIPAPTTKIVTDILQQQINKLNE